MADDFHSTIDTILSPNEYRMRAAAGAWTALAGAATQSQDALQGIADDASDEPGVGLLDLAERLSSVGGWGAGAGSVAMAIARQLQGAGDATAKAAERALSLQKEYEGQEEGHASKADDATAHGWVQADTGMAMHAARMAELADEARTELTALNETYASVTGGSAPSAPEVGSAGGSQGPGHRAAPSGAGGADGAGQPASFVTAANGSQVGAGSYPYSNTVGPEGGDFAGWVRSPGTGFLVDPATGREFDSVSGRWIDPVTGRPFGEVTEYATRLAGLGGGPGTLAGPAGVGLTAVGGGGGTAAAFGGLYGGTVPPSVAHAGPAQQQVARQAAHNLSHNAGVAGRYAAREAAQGGRPYMPPPGAGSGTGAAASGGGRCAAGVDAAGQEPGRAAVNQRVRVVG